MRPDRRKAVPGEDRHGEDHEFREPARHADPVHERNGVERDVRKGNGQGLPGQRELVPASDVQKRSQRQHEERHRGDDVEPRLLPRHTHNPP